MADLGNGVIGWHLHPGLGCLWRAICRACAGQTAPFPRSLVFEARHVRHGRILARNARLLQQSNLSKPNGQALGVFIQDAGLATNMDETGSVVNWAMRCRLRRRLTCGLETSCAPPGRLGAKVAEKDQVFAAGVPRVMLGAL
jgi:hypothetical protein